MGMMFGRAALRAAASCALALMLAACGGGAGNGDGGAAAEAPVVTAAPAATEVVDGQSATLHVTATGTEPLRYQWQKDGIPIPGATLPSYTTPPLAHLDSRSAYRVLVSNAGGSILSEAAMVVVQAVPVRVEVAPQPASVLDGYTATFRVQAAGSQPRLYQWLRNGMPVDGAHSSAWTIDPATLADDGASISVRVANTLGEVTTVPVTLAVAPSAARITTRPSAQTVPEGALVTFSVVAKGTPAITYQWLADGAPIAGATSSTYSLLATLADNGKLVSVAVSNAHGSDTSAAVALTVDSSAPIVVNGPPHKQVQAGEPATWSVVAAGSPPLQYQWERSNDGGLSWTAIAAATSASFSMPGATLAWADNHVRVRVVNAMGSVVSAPALLRVTPNVHVIAGVPGGTGYADGQGADVRFDTPYAAVADSAGNIYVAEWANATIRKIAPDGTVTTVAGRLRERSLRDGPAAGAQFQFPSALVLDGSGNLYVGDYSAVRKITPGGMVSTVAGSAQRGSADGVGGAATFRDIKGIALDASGNMTVVDGGESQTIRRIAADGTVTTLAGKAGELGQVDGPGGQARFTYLTAIATDAAGNHYVADEQVIRRVAPDGTVALFAGAYGATGNYDGPRLYARFSAPKGLAFDRDGNLYVATDAFIRRIATDGTTTTVAGGAVSNGGDVDGTGPNAHINYAYGLAAAPDGSSFVFTAPFHGTIRRVTTAGTVTTIAGTTPRYERVDGPGSAARFSYVNVLALDPQGNVNMPEFSGVRRIDPSGVVSTRGLGLPHLVNMRGIAIDAAGTTYVADSQGQQVAKVTAGGIATVIAGVAGAIGHQDGPGHQARFAFPTGIAVDAAGNVFVADSQNSVIRRIDTGGTVTTVVGQPGVCGTADGIGQAALLCRPQGLAFDSLGRLHVADEWAHTIRRIAANGEVTTVGGSPHQPGLQNGLVSRFEWPLALAFDTDDNLYVADSGNAAIRRITRSGYTTTVIGKPGVHALQPGPGGAINRPVGIAVRADGRLVLATELAVVGD